MSSRRKFLKAAAVSVSIGIGTAGCMDAITDSEQPTNTPTDSVDVENPEPVSAAAFDAWEPDTNCNGGENESMYNSEISVRDVYEAVDSTSTVIVYDGLPTEQKKILAEVLSVGGYATCETSDAFRDFTEKGVYGNTDDGSDDSKVVLEYDSMYYRLYIRQQDQVYAY